MRLEYLLTNTQTIEAPGGRLVNRLLCKSENDECLATVTVEDANSRTRDGRAIFRTAENAVIDLASVFFVFRAHFRTGKPP